MSLSVINFLFFISQPTRTLTLISSARVATERSERLQGLENSFVMKRSSRMSAVPHYHLETTLGTFRECAYCAFGVPRQKKQLHQTQIKKG